VPRMTPGKSIKKSQGYQANWSRVNYSNKKYRGTSKRKLINNVNKYMTSKMRWNLRRDQEKKMLKRLESHSMSRSIIWREKMLTSEVRLCNSNNSSQSRRIRLLNQKMRSWGKLFRSWKCSFNKKMKWFRRTWRMKWVRCNNWWNFKSQPKVLKLRFRD